MANTDLRFEERTPLRLPDLEATGVEYDGGATARREGDALHRHLILRDGRLARSACLSAPWPAPHACETVERQAPLRELGANEGLESLLVHAAVSRPRFRKVHL
jgi:hypothetical protein